MKLKGLLAEKGLHALDDQPHMHAGHKIPRIWFIVADRQKAHIYHKVENGLELIADARAIGQGMDISFIPALANWLNLAEQENVFDRLVIVAAPHTMGDIRAALPHNVDNRVTAEIAKDLTGLPVKEIFEHLDNVVWF